MEKLILMENTKDKDPILGEINKLDGKVKLILWIGAPVLILMPILTTQLDWFFDFTTTGNIGDTLGGATAPVIGVISALLIYFSFRAQISANRIIQNQINQQRKEDNEKKEFNYQMEIYRNIQNSIENFSYKRSKDEYHGIDAITKYFSQLTYMYYELKGDVDTKNNNYIAFEGIIKLIDILTDRIDLSRRLEIDCTIVLVLIDLQFNHIIWSNLHEEISNVFVIPIENSSFYKLCKEINKIKLRINSLNHILSE